MCSWSWRITMFKSLLLINLKWLLHSMFSGGSAQNVKKKSNAKKKLTGVFIALLAFYVIAVMMFAMCSVFFSFSSAFGCTELEWFYFALVGVMVFLFTFIGSVFSTQNIIFNAKDNELLLSMPVPTFYILASRVTLLFVLDLFYAVLLAIPAVGVYFYQFGFSLKMLIIYVVSVLLIVVFSAAITSFFGWLIAVISSKMKKGTLFQTLLSLLFFAAYMLFFTNLQNYINVLVLNGEQIAEAIRKYLSVFYFFGTAVSHGSLASLTLMAVTAIIPFALACLLISKSFIKITTSKKADKKKKYVEKELTVSSVRTALLRKELTRFFSLPIYILNCGMGSLMSLVLSAFMMFRGSEMLSAFAMLGESGFEGMMPIILCIVFGFCSGMCNSSAASISLEGSRINVLRSMPINSDDFYFAKFTANFIIGLPPLFVSVIMASIGLKLGVADTLTVMLASVAFFALTVFINLLCNTLMPKFAWSSEAIVIKQAVSVIMGMFGIMAACATAFAPYFALAGYLSSASYLLIISAICALLCLIFVRYFKTGGKKRFENMHI